MEPKNAEKIKIQEVELYQGIEQEMGAVAFTEQEIIDFALMNDPIPLHTDLEFAKNSHFKGLVSSGAHIFNYFHTQYWAPKFGPSVYAGMGIKDWQFHLPCYAGMEVRGKLFVAEIVRREGSNVAQVKWKFEFRDKNEGLVQQMRMSVLHLLDNEK